MRTRLLLLSADPALPSLCLHVDNAGHILERAILESGHPLAATPQEPVARTILVVPGTDARALWLDLPPAHSAAQALAAARLMLADHLARADDTLHLAIAPQQGTAPRLVVVVERLVVQEWIARAGALGVTPDVVVPDHLLLPPADGDVLRVADTGDRWLVRGQSLAFSAEPVLAAHILADRQWLPVDTAELEPLFAAAALAPAINLLQYQFAPATSTPTGAASWRLSLWLALALLVSPLLLTAVQAVRYELAARAIETRAHDVARALLPANDAAGSIDELHARMRAAQAPEAFAAATHALFGAVTRTPGAHLQALDYRRGEPLRATLHYRVTEDLETIRAMLADSGWQLVAGDSAASGGGLSTELKLEPEA
jgi:general secretion pathway protein L